MKRVFYLMLSFVLAIMFTGASYPGENALVNMVRSSTKQNLPVDKKIKKEFNVKSGQQLILDLEIGGDIKVEGWNKEIVSIEAEISGDDAENVEVEFEETGNGLEVTAEYLDNEDSDIEASFTVFVPKKFDVKFTTMGGGVVLKGIEGELKGKTMGGGLELDGLKGRLELTTMGGGISLSNSDVDGNVKTMGGNISVENVTGNVDAKTMGGNIIQKNVKRRAGESAGDEVNISTMGGAIEVDEAPYGTKVKTMGGNISVNKAEKYVDAHTMGGGIQIKSVDGWVKATTMGGSIEVNMVGDGSAANKDITLTSMSGDITVTVPSNFSMDLDLEISYDKRHDDVEIVSDFKFDEKKTTEWEQKNGNKRKFIYGTGELNGGKNKVSVKTVNGNIYLKKK